MLAYLYDLHKSTVTNIQVMELINGLYFDYECQKHDIQLLGLGYGTHNLYYQNVPIIVEVRKFIDGKAMLNSYDCKRPVIVEEVIVTVEHENHKEVMKRLIKEADEHVMQIFDDPSTGPKKVKKFVYSADDMSWDLMNSSQSRSLNTLFLRKGEKEKLMQYVDDFVAPTTKADYQRFDIPYKCNILLYGRPGMGKTSTILATASHLGVNIGIIPLSSRLDDIKLVHAMHSVKRYDCKVLVLEDIDCLFVERKANDTVKNGLTLSGILNCLDGLFRNEGIIVFLTANNITEIDEALLRSARVDYKIKYDWANKHQIKACFETYFPDADKFVFDGLIHHIGTRKLSLATLQQFLFRHRNVMNITEHFDNLELGVEGKSCENADRLYV